MRPIQHWLASRWDHSLSSIDLPLPLTPDLLEAIEVWLDTEWILQGVPLLSPDLYLCMDISMEGTGGIPQWERRQRRLEKISHIPPHQSLKNVGGQVSTPIFQFGDTVTNCTPLWDNATMVSYLR